MPMPIKPTSARACAYCSKILTRKTYNGRLEDRGVFLRRKYCDQVCMAQANVKNVLSSHRREAQKYRKVACEMCGTTSNLDVHHIDGDTSRNEEENLMTLCDPCHTKWHWEHGKTPWKERSICTVCGQPARRNKMCQKHFQRWKLYGNPLLTKRKSAGRTFTLVTVSPTD